MPHKRIPSPRVMAAALLYTALEGPYFRTPDDLTGLFGTKVSDAKRERVIAQLDKLCAKFRARMRKITDNYEKPLPKRRKGTRDARPEALRHDAGGGHQGDRPDGHLTDPGGR